MIADTIVPATLGPIPIVSSAAECIPRIAGLGSVGRARVIAFSAPVSGVRVCATIASLNPGTYAASSVPSYSDPLVSGSIVNTSISLTGKATVDLAGLALHGRWAIAPGGVFPDDIVGDTTTASRVVVIFSGQQILLVGMSALTMVDLAKILRDQPDVFGADAVERALVISTGAMSPIIEIASDKYILIEAKDPQANISEQSRLVIRKL